MTDITPAPVLFPGEQDAVMRALAYGERYGYGNLIVHLRRAWAEKLMADVPGMTLAAAMKATDVQAAGSRVVYSEEYVNGIAAVATKYLERCQELEGEVKLLRERDRMMTQTATNQFATIQTLEERLDGWYDAEEALPATRHRRCKVRHTFENGNWIVAEAYYDSRIGWVALNPVDPKFEIDEWKYIDDQPVVPKSE